MPPKTAQAISTSQNHSHVLTKIPFIQRIVEYSASDDVRRIFTLAQVTPSWRETVEHYNGTAFRFLKLSCFKYNTEYPYSIGARCYKLLWRCAYHGTCFWMLETMVRAGIPLNRLESSYGDIFNPLFLATFGNQKKCVELLLKAGADRMIGNEMGVIAAHVAAGQGSLELLELLLQEQRERQLKHRDFNASESCLHHAAAGGNEAVFRRLLELYGSSKLANEPNYYQQTPLHIACKRNQLNIVKLLLGILETRDAADDNGDNNSDGNSNNSKASNIDADAAFNFACACGSADVVEFFIKQKKVNLTAPVPAGGSNTENGLTALVRKCLRGPIPNHAVAARADRVEVARILIESGCDTAEAEVLLTPVIPKSKDQLLKQIWAMIHDASRKRKT